MSDYESKYQNQSLADNFDSLGCLLTLRDHCDRETMYLAELIKQRAAVLQGALAQCAGTMNMICQAHPTAPMDRGSDLIMQDMLSIGRLKAGEAISKNDPEIIWHKELIFKG